MIITKQMIRDKVANNGPISVSGLAYSIFKDEVTSVQYFNLIMTFIIELENEKVVRYNPTLGCYETDLILN